MPVGRDGLQSILNTWLLSSSSRKRAAYSPPPSPRVLSFQTLWDVADGEAPWRGWMPPHQSLHRARQESRAFDVRGPYSKWTNQTIPIGRQPIFYFHSEIWASWCCLISKYCKRWDSAVVLTTAGDSDVWVILSVYCSHNLQHESHKPEYNTSFGSKRHYEDLEGASWTVDGGKWLQFFISFLYNSVTKRGGLKI